MIRTRRHRAFEIFIWAFAGVIAASYAVAGDYGDLSEHTNALVGLVAVFAGLSAYLVWRSMTRLEAKVDKIMDWIRSFISDCSKCKTELNDRYLPRKDFDDWRRGRDELWDALNHHTHDAENGKVTR